MARSNVHQLATRLLDTLNGLSTDGTFQGKLSDVAVAAGLSSVRSSEAVKVLEELGRIEVVQRGRRGRDTVVSILSHVPVSASQAASVSRARPSRKGRITYEEVGRAVVERLLGLARDDGLRAAQVEAFASEAQGLRNRIEELEAELAGAEQRETALRIELKAAEEALARNEENMRRVFSAQDRGVPTPDQQMGDDDARAVLDILRSGGGG